MEVNPNGSAGPVQKVTGKAVLPPRPTPATDSASFAEAEAVNRAMQQVPAVRPESVARGRELIGDANYPPLATIDAIAKLVGFAIVDTVRE